MRVLIVAPWGTALGGAETMLLTLLAHARDAGLDYTVAFLEDGPAVAEARALGAAVHVIPAQRLRNAAAFRSTVGSLRRLVTRLSPEVVLGWSPKVHLYVAPAVMSLRHKPTVVWWQHGFPPEAWIDYVATAMRADAVGCSSHASARAQSSCRPRRPTFVVHPGIPAPSAVGDRISARRALGYADDDVVVGIVGRLQPWKGQDRFLQALQRLRTRGLAVKGLVVGGDAYNLSPRYASDLTDLVGRLRLEAAVTMTGQVADAVSFVRAMDVLVNASEVEPFGIVLLEAMACGVPPVAVQRGGPVEIIEPGRSGVLVPTGAPHDLAAGLEALVRDGELRRRMGAASRERFERAFTASVMAERLGSELRSLVDGRGS